MRHYPSQNATVQRNKWQPKPHQRMVVARESTAHAAERVAGQARFLWYRQRRNVGDASNATGVGRSTRIPITRQHYAGIGG